jgi:hypothetical protein
VASVTLESILDLWTRAGGNPQAGQVAAAVSRAESGWRPTAESPPNSNGTVDRGLWQVNSVHGALSTFDPLSNAKAAVEISGNGTNWKPWCTAWSDGACGTKGGSPPPPGGVAAGSPAAAYMTGDLSPVTVDGSGGAGVETAGIGGGVGGIGSGLLSWMGLPVVGVGMVVGGALLMLAGAYVLGRLMLAQSPQGAREVVRLVGQVTPAGRATRAARVARRGAPARAQHAAASRERRAEETHRARLASRSAADSRRREGPPPRTVYVTPSDPAYDRIARRAAEQKAARARAMAQTDPPF